MNKIKEVFAEMVVLKNPERTKFFADLSLPSYMRDWLVMKFSDESGNIDYDGVTRYIKKYIPSREDYEQFKFQMVNGDSVRFLARVRVAVDVKTGKTLFELPDFGGVKTGAGGEVANDIVSRWQDTLLRESENWGIIDLVWEQDFSKRPPRGFIKLIGYQPFCPYSIDLDYYRDARQKFTTAEWLDVLIAAVDYNPEGYDTEEQKMYFLQRLLPFVERRVNLIELAPMGTGKSYVYEKISKRGWLVSSGTISRASLLYDNNKRTGGLITRFDYVAFDEIQSLRFEQPDQIQAALKSYMEFGEVKGFDTQIIADAGIIVLGNIDASKFNADINMVNEINPIFREAAILDRFHGFIPGWKIPRFHTGIIADGWALNTEYFAEVLHVLRDDMRYTALVDSCLAVPPKSDKRDLTAITRLCTGFVKLLFPQAETKSDIDPDEFIKYCLEPAKAMRTIIKKQLCVLAPKEFDIPGKRDVPDIQYKN
ncbi:BREX system Lon protease-like protein BrxL [Parasporobacterium paucivorans]|uniref:ATP-dependent Lon protease n=1 Tax=Parasporobacterium paucivorans DSM 15970 TaxID=1122934 RepID=A0A1M6AZ51_9FIRM|nr:BREX system Lon protease-like protein BrxL [Parasporobacterium paucivorans]SHI41784.1 ATP-dependent Lon protease [Parasporobacterium paucivorans DSM 15970]